MSYPPSQLNRAVLASQLRLIEDITALLDPSVGTDPVGETFYTQAQIDAHGAFATVQGFLDATPSDWTDRTVELAVPLTFSGTVPSQSALVGSRAAGIVFTKTCSGTTRFSITAPLDNWTELVATQAVTAQATGDDTTIDVAGTPFLGLTLEGVFAELTFSDSSVVNVPIYGNTDSQLSITPDLPLTVTSVRVMRPSVILSQFDSIGAKPAASQRLFDLQPQLRSRFIFQDADAVMTVTGFEFEYDHANNNIMCTGVAASCTFGENLIDHDRMTGDPNNGGYFGMNDCTLRLRSFCARNVAGTIASSSGPRAIFLADRSNFNGEGCVFYQTRGQTLQAFEASNVRLVSWMSFGNGAFGAGDIRAQDTGSISLSAGIIAPGAKNRIVDSRDHGIWLERSRANFIGVDIVNPTDSGIFAFGRADMRLTSGSLNPLTVSGAGRYAVEVLDGYNGLLIDPAITANMGGSTLGDVALVGVVESFANIQAAPGNRISDAVFNYFEVS